MIKSEHQKSIENYDVTSAASEGYVINKILQNCMEAMGGDRAYLFQFHNGTFNLSGHSMYYFSNTNEICSPGISHEIQSLQKLPISLLAPTWMPRLEKHGYFILNPKDETHEQSRMILEEQGIQKLAIAGIVYLGKIIGFIGVDFVRTNPTKKDININSLTEAAHMIQAVIVREDHEK